ncbi:hypothetical protein [Lignipirellula cremea]|uniref:Uncharacterized protein n=1 Tax=Lignipirellula cremea TaxID=2528010 RepID=A0A518DN83_9BACT|nr:hypothetical protein [Lignipirellula cremea]QDU93296.1 hypothetical protein Pla8534_10760 [Lignipirellula cremea]
MRLLSAGLLILGCWFTIGASAMAEEPAPLWVYAPTNFQSEQDVQRLLTLLPRAAKAGYHGVVIADSKFGRLAGRPQSYYRNLQQVRQAAEDLKLELIPLVMPIGYSNSLLQNDPNLAAGLPVKNCELLVQNGVASLADSPNLLPGGDLETAGKAVPTGWDFVDQFGSGSQLDRQEKHAGDSSLRLGDFTPQDGRRRIAKKVRLQPFHQYRLTVWIKTEDLRGSEFRFLPIPVDSKRPFLSHANLGVKPTQPWTRHRVIFNSLEHKEVLIYLGVWEGKSGKVWIDDIRLEEVAGVNMVRRSGCPLHVRCFDGSVTYEEGRDFERWEDPQLGRVPYLGEYDDSHEAPPLKITPGSRITNGQPLMVSYYHTVRIHNGQVCASLVADEVFALLQEQIQQIDKLLKPKRFFMAHDEIRVAGWDELAKDRSTGQLLAGNVERCVKLIRALRPDAQILVWSDMFDPHHNARDNYYLVRGTVADSWKGLDPAVNIVNWNSGKAAASLAFFADRGHDQIIAGYYDSDVAANAAPWKQAAAGVKNIRGYMYTTWERQYDDLEAFARLVREESR